MNHIHVFKNNKNFEICLFFIIILLLLLGGGG